MLSDLATVDALLGRVDKLPRANARPSSIRRSLGSTRGSPPIREEGSAEARFKLAAASFRERDVRFYEAVTLLEYGEWLAEGGRDHDAEPLLREAGEIFEQLQAAPWIERLAKSPIVSLRLRSDTSSRSSDPR